MKPSIQGQYGNATLVLKIEIRLDKALNGLGYPSLQPRLEDLEHTGYFIALPIRSFNRGGRISIHVATCPW